MTRVSHVRDLRVGMELVHDCACGVVHRFLLVDVRGEGLERQFRISPAVPSHDEPGATLDAFAPLASILMGQLFIAEDVVDGLSREAGHA